MKAIQNRYFSLTSNQLKLIACFSMLLDHTAILLLPNLIFLRYIGRLAMPIFAFFIAEGCKNTSSLPKYFGRVFLLGVLCQAVYLAEMLVSGGKVSLYLNIFFTLSLSIIICAAFLRFKDSYKVHSKKRYIHFLCFACTLLFTILAVLFCEYSQNLVGIKITVDYGFFGVILPLFALLSENKNSRILLYFIGTVIFCAASSVRISYIWFALFAIPLLCLYNGKRGKHKLKYFFYIFYPAHLVILYLIQLLLS